MGTRNQELINNFGNTMMAIHNKKIASALERTAWKLVHETDVPIDTHNLWDSIGCGIYHNGSLMKISYPPRVATKPRTNIYGIDVPDKEYWGRKELEDMIEAAPSEVVNFKGWCLYYVAAMPYAKIQDSRSDVDVLRDELVKPTFTSFLHTLDL